MLLTRDLVDAFEGAGDSSIGGVPSVLCLDVESRELRWEKNELIPAPHELIDDRASVGVGCDGAGGTEPTRLSGRIPLGCASGGCGEDQWPRRQGSVGFRVIRRFY